MRMLRRSLLLSFALLLSSCSLFAQTGYLQGTVMKHSGKADDTFIISDPNDIQTVQNMLSNLPPTAQPQWPQFGFRGYGLQNFGVTSIPNSVHVFQGVIEIYNTSGSNFFTDSKGLESFLSSKAQTQLGASAAPAPSQSTASSSTLLGRAIPSDSMTVIAITDDGGPAPTPSPTPAPTPAPTPKQLPMSGSEPTYDPGKWNKEGVVLNNNCYAYATDNMTNTFPQPGKGSGAEPTPPYTCDNVTAAAVSDGLVKASCDNACPKGSFKVALVINPDPLGNDFHWYRQDSNGNWSHKPGGTDATNKDNKGNPITDPRTADRGGYTNFCGCFCVDPTAVKIK